jgi:hypothetical protein
MSTLRVIVCTASVLLAVASDAPSLAQAAPDFSRNAATLPRLPYGLDCRACMYSSESGCYEATSQPLVVEAIDGEQVDDKRNCQTLDLLDQGRQTTCSGLTVTRFRSVRVLRGTLPVAAADRFVAMYRTGFDVPQAASGIFLRPDTRYVLFARKANPRSPAGARWGVTAACPIAASHVLADPDVPRAND